MSRAYEVVVHGEGAVIALAEAPDTGLIPLSSGPLFGGERLELFLLSGHAAGAPQDHLHQQVPPLVVAHSEPGGDLESRAKAPAATEGLVDATLLDTGRRARQYELLWAVPGERASVHG